MNLHPDRLYYGVAPRLLIHCAEHIAERENFSVVDFAESLGVSVDEALPVLGELLAAGYVQQTNDSYAGTKLLNQLANAKIGAGLSRSEAEGLLAAVIRKAEQINADAAFGARVGCIVVFGSFLTTKEIIGDLDLGVHVLEQRRTWESTRQMLDMMRQGRTPQAKAYIALRLRQPRKISVHQLSEVLSLNTPYRVVFGELPGRVE